MPLKEVRPGMRGVGKTVFSGTRVEDFQVEVLGVMENVWAKQSLILARLSGGPLAATGVMQGMSGSPVYIGGRLVGAVAMAFPFSKEPIAGIRPIEDMLRAESEPPPKAMRAHVSLADQDLTRAFPQPANVLAGGSKLVDIATPVALGGFTRNTVESFAPKLRALGLECQQGASGGHPTGFGNPSDLQPGSMISVQLLSGDMSVGADGTVTYINGRKVYAFGHRLLSVGSTELPFARAGVLALLPNLQSSFKISNPKEWMGAITDDRSTAISGRLGQHAAMVPVAISVARQPGAAAGKTDYHIEMVNDRFLEPLLMQMAIFSALDATERSYGASSFLVKGEMQFKGAAAPLKIDNMYAGDFNTAMQASLAVSVPLAYVMQSGFDSLELKSVSLSVESYDRKRELQIDQAWTSQREVRPGEKVELHVILTGENGREVLRQVSYKVSEGTTLGPLYFTVADGNNTNLTEFRQFLTSQPKSAGQMVAFLNGLRPNTHAYVRVWRAGPSYDIGGENFPDPPPSADLILSKSAPLPMGGLAPQNSKVAELEISAGDMVITGSRTVQVEVKE
jgi:hypothetical protein